MSDDDSRADAPATPSPETSQPTGRFRRRFLSLALAKPDVGAREEEEPDEAA